MEEPRVFFLCSKLVPGQNANYDNISGGGSRAHKNHTGMHRVQATQLQHDEG